LLATAVQKNSVLGETEQVKTVNEQLQLPVKSESVLIFDNVQDEVQDDGQEDDQGQNLDEIEIAEDADDLELAWENLDVARLILSKQSDNASQLALGDVHIALGDVSLESGNNF
jgi:hypothetical protein